MDYQHILVEGLEDGVGLITLDRPDALNAINSRLSAELVHALRAFDDDPEIGCVIITGAEKVFAAGADIDEMRALTPADWLTGEGLKLFDEMAQIKKPIIAAVSGWALGGGCELAMACDMIVASKRARFGQPEVNLGIIPGAGGTQRLTRAVGKAIAMEMILNDRKLGAEEAQRLGLVNAVYPVEEYLDRAIAMARQIAARAPLAVQLAKASVNAAFEQSLAEGLKTEARNFYTLFATEDQKEGMAAFLEKRDPEWKGR